MLKTLQCLLELYVLHTAFLIKNPVCLVFVCVNAYTMPSRRRSRSPAVVSTQPPRLARTQNDSLETTRITDCHPRTLYQLGKGEMLSCGTEDIDVGAISHKGVIRAIIALASGWNMLGRPPARVPSGSAQVISITTGGMLKLDATDIMLTQMPDPDDIN